MYTETDDRWTDEIEIEKAAEKAQMKCAAAAEIQSSVERRLQCAKEFSSLEFMCTSGKTLGTECWTDDTEDAAFLYPIDGGEDDKDAKKSEREIERQRGFTYSSQAAAAELEGKRTV